jgi:hypothetical protein
MTTKEQELEQLAKECFAEMLNDQHTFVPTIIKKYLQSATADLRAEVERQDRRAKVNADLWHNAEAQLATEREKLLEVVRLCEEYQNSDIEGMDPEKLQHASDDCIMAICKLASDSPTTPPSATEGTK